jgi:hypothetical protein
VRRVKLARKCLKKRLPVVTARLGFFVGRFRFRGERGYTSVAVHRVQGGVGDPLAISPKRPECEFHESAAERTAYQHSVGLEASTWGTGVQDSFSVSRVSARRLASQREASTAKSDGYFFFAVVGEMRRGMRIIRLVGAFSPPSDFVFDQSLTSATVTPPPPFSGSGSFLRNTDDSTTWTGSLAVAIPGLGTVPLAGTGSKSELATQATLKQHQEEEFEASLTESRNGASR